MASKKTTPDVEPTRDLVHPRLVWETLNAAHPTLFTDTEKQAIDAGIRDGRLYFGFPKSGSGTKGTNEPEKPFTIARDEADPSKPIGAVSPVCSRASDLTMWARYIHVFTAFASYEYDEKSSRTYTKRFGDVAGRIGLTHPPDKRAQAYGAYVVLHPFLRSKLEAVTFPPVPFSIEGTDAAPVRRTFAVKAYHKDDGPNAPVTINILNPAKTDGEEPITEQQCEAWAAKYVNFVFLRSDRPDWQAALSFYTLEEEVTEIEQQEAVG